MDEQINANVRDRILRIFLDGELHQRADVGGAIHVPDLVFVDERFAEVEAEGLIAEEFRESGAWSGEVQPPVSVGYRITDAGRASADDGS